MVANVILSIFVIVLSVVLIKALITGRIEFGSGRGAMIANRSISPVSFWVIFLIGLSIVALFLWLVIS